MTLPSFKPSVLPSGEYLAEIISDPVEKTSPFDQTKTFLTLGMDLQNARGEHFSYSWAFNDKAHVYREMLLLLGGKEEASGIVIPPNSYRGKFFVIHLIERAAKNDATKMVNEIVRVRPQAELDVEPEKETGEDPEPETKVPF